MSRIRPAFDRSVGDTARNATTLARTLATVPGIDEVELVDVAFVSGTTSVLSHGLGRPWRSWCVVRPRAVGMATVVEASHTADEQARVLKLTPGATFVANVRIR